MKVHEYQGKRLLSKDGVPVPKGEVIPKASEARVAVSEGLGYRRRQGADPAGGRGKGGGVKVVRPEEAQRAAQAMIGMRLVTHQTGPEGHAVQRVLIEEGLEIKRELYWALCSIARP